MRRVAAVLLLSSLVLVPTSALAQWSATGSGAVTASAVTLVNATGFRADCAPGKKVKLSWTITADPLVQTYAIVRTNDKGETAVVSSQILRTTSTIEDAPPTGAVTIRYTYTIQASAQFPWRTPLLSSTTAVSLDNKTCTVT